MAESDRFEIWAVVELFGHQKIAGRVSEQALAGTTFLRVDVPDTPRSQAYTRIFGAGAIYGITPCTEEQACAVLQRGWGFTHPEFVAKQLPAPAHAAVDEEPARGAQTWGTDAELEEEDVPL